MQSDPKLTFTLDTNCIIDLDDSRPNALHVRRLVEAHPSRADVAYVAISASEKQKSGTQLGNFSLFKKRLVSLGTGDLTELVPMMYLDVCYLDHGYLVGPEMHELERAISAVLFPGVELNWPDYAEGTQS